MRQSIRLKPFIIIVAGVAVVGGGVFVGFRHASEVRGAGDVHAGEPGPSAAAGTPADQVRAYMLGLQADDYTTYTHPVYGFSLDVPKEFEVFRTTTADKDHTVFRHPRLPLALEITVYPMPRHPELVSWLGTLPADYDLEPPEGADSTAAGWLDENQLSPGQQTMHEWFAHQDSLYEVLLMAPNPKLLQWWRPQVVNTDLSLSAR
jgi:hypothetical protein